MVFETFFSGFDERGFPCPLNNLWQFSIEDIAETDPAEVLAGVNVAFGIYGEPPLTE
jgi:hypothetical protein